MTLPELAPLVSAGVALLLRLVGERLDRPVARSGAGVGGILAGWGMLDHALAPPGLVVFAMAAGVASALAVTSAKPRSKRKPVRQGMQEEHGWLAAVAVFGAWWLAGGGTPRVLPMALGLVAIAACGLLAADVWAVGAAAFCLAAGLLAVGAKLAAAAPALVIAGACLGGGLLLPLAAGLGGLVALVMEQRHGLPMAMAALAPVVCLLLLVWWRHRFARFGRAAAPVRAGVAAGLVCVLAFSAAAMGGLR